MLEKVLFFALGYYLGSHGARDGLGELVGVVKSLANTEEFSSAAGMAMSTVKSVVDRSGGSSGEGAGAASEWWEAATR